MEYAILMIFCALEPPSNKLPNAHQIMPTNTIKIFLESQNMNFLLKLHLKSKMMAKNGTFLPFSPKMRQKMTPKWQFLRFDKFAQNYDD